MTKKKKKECKELGLYGLSLKGKKMYLKKILGNFRIQVPMLPDQIQITTCFLHVKFYGNPSKVFVTYCLWRISCYNGRVE